MQTAVYLVHFKQPLRHARHYLGFVENSKAVLDRLHRHINGNGAALMRAAAAAGIEFVLVRTWQGKSRRFERRLKLQKHHPRLCPVCNPAGFASRTRRTPDN
jgi:hypothetical protein